MRPRRANAAWLVLCAGTCGSWPARPARAETWAPATASPAPLGPDTPVGEVDATYLAACGRPDARLMAVARALRAGAPPGAEASHATAIMRSYGTPFVWPRTWRATERAYARGAQAVALRGWLAAWPTPGELRCGVASGPSASGAGETDVLVVAAEALADLAPIPMRVGSGATIDFRARLLVPSSKCALSVQTPDGDVQTRPVTCADGAVAEAVPITGTGAFTLQLVVDVAGGPRPALEAKVYADVAPFVETDAQGKIASLTALHERLNARRKRARTGPLARDVALDLVAQRHAERMAATRTLAHDVGDGSLEVRLRTSGVEVTAGGENVAHAASLELAHESLENSPSHAAAMTRSIYDSVGLAAAADGAGNVYLVEVFARRGAPGATPTDGIR